MNRKTVAIIFGGCSPEYGVSLESASSVIAHLNRDKYNPLLIGVTKAGEWYHYKGDAKSIAGDTWFSPQSCTPVALSPNRGSHELMVFCGSEVERLPVDIAFPIMHGKNGEDGTIQGFCELAGLPLAGCGALASALCMDKDRAHKLARAAGVEAARSFVLEGSFDEDLALKAAEGIGYPLFVKPVKSGSSYGITKVTESEKLPEAISNAFSYDDAVMVEEAVPGFEVGCAVMGNSRLITGEIDEIELADGFFDFTEKYNLITSKIHVPARITKEKSEELKCTAKKIYRALGCRGFARVDMFLKPTGEIVFNEVNTIPGFTAHSRFPGMMKAAGLSFEQIISLAIELAVEK